MINPSESEHKRHRIRMFIPLWGAQYFERWMDISAASLCSKGNILYLQARAEFELVFLTKSHDLSFVAEKIAPRLGNQIKIRTVTIDEFFPKNAPVSYAVPLTLAFTKGVQDLGEEGIGSFVIFMNADFVLSDGSLATLFQRIEEGFHIITAPSIRVVDQSVRGALTAHLRSQTDNEGFASRFLMSLAQQHLHQTVLARIINEPQPIEAWYYHLVYWRLSTNCLAARYFLLMPFCFQLRRQIMTATCPIDYGFIEQACPGGRYTALADSDDFLMVELQERDSEDALLMPAPIAPTPPRAVDRKLAQIGLNGGAWSTFEHRRAFEHTLLFHSDDIPSDCQASLSEFDARMSQLLAQMPPPIPRERHPHWLGAIHHYRAAMTANGVDYPDLILDVANRISVKLFPLDKTRALATARESPVDVAGYFSSTSVIITLNELVPDIAGKLPSAVFFAANAADVQAADIDMEMSFYEPPAFAPGQRLGMYLLIDTLPNWPKFCSLCDSVIEAGTEVILVFRNSGWTEVPFEGHGWILSRLSYFFSGEKYQTQVEFFSITGQGKSQSQTESLPLAEEAIYKFDGGSINPVWSDKFVGFTIRLARAR